MSENTLTDSPSIKLWFSVKVITLAVISFNLFVFFLTVNTFFDEGPSPVPDSTCINIGLLKFVITPPILTLKERVSFIFAPTLNPFAIWDGGFSRSVSSRRYKCELIPIVCVLIGSNTLHRTLNESVSKSCGGTICVMYPLLSRLKESLLNPTDTKDFAPKLELEFVIDWSAPLSATKCSANPIAKTETAWMIESFDALTWAFL